MHNEPKVSFNQMKAWAGYLALMKRLGVKIKIGPDAMHWAVWGE